LVRHVGRFGNLSGSSDDIFLMRRVKSPVLTMMPLAMAAVLVLAACGGDDASGAPGSTLPPTASETTEVVSSVPAEEPEFEELVALDAWVRPPAAGQTMAAGYVTFVNPNEFDVSIVDVSANVGPAELHETVSDDDGVMRMQHRPDGFVVAAGGELVFAPGGAHVMFMDLDPLEFALIDSVELVFDVGSHGTMSVVAEVRRDVGADDGHHGHGDHDHGDDVHGHGGDVHGGMFEDLDLVGWAGVMHDLDDELHAGVLDVERQRATVAAFREVVITEELPASVDLEALLDALDRLDAALDAEDVATAAAVAFEVHDLAHALAPHSH
jgi:copper(I)-binding protein